MVVDDIPGRGGKSERGRQKQRDREYDHASRRTRPLTLLTPVQLTPTSQSTKK